MSKSEIHYTAEENAIQMSVHIFVDDLESALKEKGVDSLFIATEKEVDNANTFISSYLNQTLNIKVDDQTKEAQFLGKEMSDDLMAIWCYLEILEVPDCASVSISNRILFEMFDDQRNIVKYSTDTGKKDYYIFDLKDQEKEFSCE